MPRAALRESAVQAAVIAHWRALVRPGTLVAAIPNARAHGQPGLTRGLPDLLVLGGAVGVGFIELKVGRGTLRREQADFQATCVAAGVHHAVARDRDEPIAVLERWGVVWPRVGSASA